MPYIPGIDKDRFWPALEAITKEITAGGISDGELNFVITMVAQAYIARHGKSYNTLSDVIKALECAKLEFYRRVVAPYEDEKIRQNGDVYEI